MLFYRYDGDIVKIRSDLRQLWQSLGMLDSCCTNSSANGMHPESDAGSETLIALKLLMTETKQLTSAAMNGFKEEKRYARSTINALDNTICKALEEVDDTVTHVKATVSQERKNIGCH